MVSAAKYVVRTGKMALTTAPVSCAITIDGAALKVILATSAIALMYCLLVSFFLLFGTLNFPTIIFGHNF